MVKFINGSNPIADPNHTFFLIYFPLFSLFLFIFNLLFYLRSRVFVFILQVREEREAMSGSSSTRSRMLCRCGSMAVLSRSGTQMNPGRLFWGCPNWKSQNCGYFRWASSDDVHCAEFEGSSSGTRASSSGGGKRVGLEECGQPRCGKESISGVVVIGGFVQIVVLVVIVVVFAIVLGFVLGKM